MAVAAVQIAVDSDKKNRLELRRLAVDVETEQMKAEIEGG